MGEPIGATIHIGGVVPATAVDGLLEVLDLESVDGLTRALDKEGHYVISDAPNYGEFTDIEDYCNEHGIAYDRYTDAKYEYESEAKFNRKATTGQPTMCYLFNCTQSEQLLVRRDLLLPVLEELEHAVWSKHPQSFLERARVELRRILCPELTELPPLTIEKADAAS